MKKVAARKPSPKAIETETVSVPIQLVRGLQSLLADIRPINPLVEPFWTYKLVRRREVALGRVLRHHERAVAETRAKEIAR